MVSAGSSAKIVGMPQHTSPATGPEPILLTIQRQMVTVEGRLPFDICKTAIETTRSDGRVRHRSVGQSLLQVDTPDTPPHVRLPLLPLVEAELSRIGVAYEVVRSIDDLASEAPLAGAAEAPSASLLPQQSHEFLCSHQHAAIETSSLGQLSELIGKVACQFPAARIGILAATREVCWRLKNTIQRHSGGLRVFVACDTIHEDVIKNWEGIPRIVIGTPNSLPNNSGFAGSWTFDAIFLVDERLLRREVLLNYLQRARQGTRVFVCLGKHILNDPKWQAELYEYAGFTRGILADNGSILPPPRIEYANLNWNVGGDLSLTSEVDYVDLLDCENRRLRAIGAILNRQRFRDANTRIALVFARKRSVDAFCRLFPEYNSIESLCGSGQHSNRVVLTSNQLPDIEVQGSTTVVWAGSRGSTMDLYRDLATRATPDAAIRIVDLQDYPHVQVGRHPDFVQTVAKWNNDRKREYRETGYLPVGGGDATQQTMELARKLLNRDIQPGEQYV